MILGYYEVVDKYYVECGFVPTHVWHDLRSNNKPTARIKKGILPSIPSYSKPVKVRHHDISINVEDFDTNGTAYNKGRYTTHVDYQSCPTASWLINGTWFGSVNAEGVDYTDHRTTGTYLSVDGDMWAIPTVEDRPQSITVNTYSKGKAEYCEDYYDQYQYNDAGDCLYDDDATYTIEQGEEDAYACVGLW